MTVVVAVLNKTAVALAADSTGSIVRPDRTVERTYETTNKLFALSKHRPVAVMNFGMTEFMGVPWETIIKSFRRKLGHDSYDTLQDYVFQFVQFLEHDRTLTPERQQRNWLRFDVSQEFERIKKIIEGEIEKSSSTKRRAKKSLRNEIAARVIKEQHAIANNAAPVTTTALDAARLIEEYSESIRLTRDSVFQDAFSLGEETVSQLSDIVAKHYLREINPSDTLASVGGGLVFAGYGEVEPFPSVISVNCHRVLCNKFIYRYGESYQSQLVMDPPAAVLPFAQTDVVNTFLKGVEPEFLQHVRGVLFGLFEGQTDQVMSVLNDVTEERMSSAARKKLDARLQEINLESAKRSLSKLQEYIKSRHIDELLRVLATAPRDELVTIAEALVNLTSVKRRIERMLPTVGGPVDVAVITKGDGFIWIRRKHYFDPELNRHFTDSYLME